jgi:amino acid transporter/nucleotide-binding universal stress UspA family protein
MAATDKGKEVEVKFRRDLGLLEITMIGLAPTIGSTIFLLVGPGIGIAGPALLIVFVLNFFVSILTAMGYMELGSAFPETGGGYLWIKTAMKEPLGFLGGWLSWFGHSIVCAFYAMGFGLGVTWFADSYGMLSGFSPFERDIFTKTLTVAVVLIFIYINYRGTKTTGRSSTYVTISLIIMVMLFIILGAAGMMMGRGSWSHLSPLLPGDNNATNALAILMAMGFTFIVFEGYEVIAQTGEECRDPEKNIPKAHWITLVIATVIFVFVALFTILGGGTTSAASHDPKAVASAANVFLPGIGLPIVVVGVILGALTSLNSLVFSSSRVSFAMGRDGALPYVFGQLHKKNRTPHVAILASGAIIITMVISLDIVKIAASADIMFLVLFTMVNAAVIILRKKKPDAKRYYIMPLFPLIPIIGMATKAVLAVSLYLYEPAAWGIALVWIVLGFGIHYLWAKRERIVEVAAPVISAIVPAAEAKYSVIVAQDNLEDKSLVEFASIVAKVEDGTVRLVHVVEIPDTLPLDAIDRSYHRDVERDMRTLIDEVAGQGVEARARVVISHRVEEALLDEVKEQEPDLMVLGWHGRRGVGRILGTTVDRMVREAPCDIVVLKTTEVRPPLRRILVFNAPAWHVTYATSYAILLAKKYNAEIVLFSAVTTDAELKTEQAYSARLAEMCRTHGIRYYEEFAKVKNIVDSVVEESKTYDMLVIGAGPEEGIKGTVLGGTQDQIAQRCPVPVLAVRKVRGPDVLAKAS